MSDLGVMLLFGAGLVVLLAIIRFFAFLTDVVEAGGPRAYFAQATDRYVERQKPGQYYVTPIERDAPKEGVAAPVAATVQEAGQPIAKPSTPDNAQLPGNADNAVLPIEARDIIRATAIEQGKAQAVAALLKSGKLTNKAEAIEQVFGCSRSGRPGSTYQQALALVEPLLAVEKYPGRTPDQEEFRQRMELAS